MYLNAHLNVYFIFYAISIPSSYCHLCPVLSCGRHHGDSGTLRQLGQEIAKHLHLSRLNDFFGCENYHYCIWLVTQLVKQCKNQRFDHVC